MNRDTSGCPPLPSFASALAALVLMPVLGLGPVAAQETASTETADREVARQESGAAEWSGPATASREQDLPPLIDREKFFGNPRYSGAQVSPEGERIAFRHSYRDVMNVWVKATDAPFDEARPVTADTTRPVPGYFWSQDGERILYVQDKGGNENFHIYSVDLDADPDSATGVPPARDLTPYGDVQARIYAVPEETPGEIVVGLNDRNAQVHDVYRVDLQTGDRELVIRNTAQVASWVTDLEGRVRLGVRQTDTGGTEILPVRGDSLGTEPVYECSWRENCSPVRFHADGERVYVTTNKGEDRDLTHLVLLDPETGETEVVESDPEGEVDFGGAIFSDRTDSLVATVYTGDRQRIYPKAEWFEEALSTLREKLPEGELGFAGSTEDERLHVVNVSRDVDPGSTYLFDRETGEVERLYRSRPELESEHLAEMRAIRYEARDGTMIPAYLTLPRGVPAEDLPLVVHPHGGPWARDTWGYDSYAQFLANRGYAVLQPNFRGSTGYGQEFLNAGNEEWGTGIMQHDISDGVKHLVEEGIADSTRVGIFGGSYGGYATLAGLTFTPEIYAAGASYVGPSSILTLLKSIPPYWKPIQTIFENRVGDLDDSTDVERMRRQSPLYHAEAIEDPLLVIQGANDPRVKKRESDQIVVAARENGVDVQYLVAPEEGHGFAKEENRLAVAAALEDFFGDHLGGREQEVSGTAGERLAALRVDTDTLTLPDTAAAAGAETVAPEPDGAKLRESTLEYAAQMKVRGQTLDLSTVRTLARGSEEGREVWYVVETAETPRGTQTDSVVVTAGGLEPVRRHATGQATVQLRYPADSIKGQITAMGRSMDVGVGAGGPVVAGGPGVDAVVAALPLEEGYATTLRSFDAQQGRVTEQTLRVTGTEEVEVPAGTYDTYVVEMESGQGSGTLHVRKEGPHHVVKASMELQAMGGATVTRELTAWKEGSAGSDGGS